MPPTIIVVPSTVATTAWTPSSTTWPTTPFTLPLDYGKGSKCVPDGAAPPTVTYSPDAVLPPVTWIVDGITIQFTPPAQFRQDPLPRPALQDCDRDNGLYLVERWRVEGEPMLATFSVQANPGVDSPLLSRTVFSESVTGSGATWYLWNGETVEQTGKPPNLGLAVVDDYLFEISGTPSTMHALINALVIE